MPRQDRPPQDLRPTRHSPEPRQAKFLPSQIGAQSRFTLSRIIMVRMCVCSCVCMHMQARGQCYAWECILMKSGDSFWESIVSFHHGFWEAVSIVLACCKNFYPMSHLASLSRRSSILSLPPQCCLLCPALTRVLGSNPGPGACLINAFANGAVVPALTCSYIC